MWGEVIIVGRAVRNLSAYVVRHPLSSLVAVLYSPFLMWRHLWDLFCGVMIIGVVGVLLRWLLVPKDWTWLLEATNTLLWLLVGFFTYRMLVRPLIDYFGYEGNPTTHGTARFAAPEEIAVFAVPKGAAAGRPGIARTGQDRLPMAGAPDMRLAVSAGDPREGHASGGGTASMAAHGAVFQGKDTPEPGSFGAGLLIGRDPHTGRLLHYTGPAHLVTMAPTRSGKGVGTIIPNLLTARRSVICIGPKGENALITAQVRSAFGPVHILDPFGVTGYPTSACNPLAHLRAGDVDIAEDVASLADALVNDPPGLAGEAHWNEEAKALINGLLMHIVAAEPDDRRNLSTLREYLTQSPDAFYELLVAMQVCTDCHGLIARAANRHLGKSDREAAGVLSAAQRHTHFLDSPRMTTVLRQSAFRFGDLKHGTATVYLVLPPDRLDAYARWLRLMIGQSLTELARATGAPRLPVLYLLDEFASLGHMAPVERAMGLMAGYGVQLWPILQDLHQLRATYGERAGTFLSNAGVLQVFGVNDHESAKLVSDLLGQETVVFSTRSLSLDSEKSGISYGEQHAARPILTPDEVRALPETTQLLFVTGRRPIVATKLRYYADRELRGLTDAG